MEFMGENNADNNNNKVLSLNEETVLSLDDQIVIIPEIVVIGVGGGGCNAVNNMFGKDTEDVKLIVANTDIKSLTQTKAHKRIQLGKNTTKGHGAGSLPETGKISAEETEEEIREDLKGTDLLFITTGMGGGTGTGATPVIARIAKEMGILTIAVVTKPFEHESETRIRIAENGIIELRKYVDTIIILPNEHLFRIANKDTALLDAYQASDEVLYLGVKGIKNLLTKSGIKNVDFADLRMVVEKGGKAVMGTGEAEGEDRAVKAVEEALSNPLLDDVDISNASGILVNITGSPDVTLFEYDEAIKKIQSKITNKKAILKIGANFTNELKGKVRVYVFAAGMDNEKEQSKKTTNINEISVDKNSNTSKNNAKNLNETVKNVAVPQQQNETTKHVLNSDSPTDETIITPKVTITSPQQEPSVRKAEYKDNDFFDMKKPAIEDEIANSKEENLFTKIFAKNSNSKKESDTKINHIKAKNKEIEIKDNITFNSINSSDDLLGIPSYLRPKK
jgi:cell division protein FtsZ